MFKLKTALLALLLLGCLAPLAHAEIADFGEFLTSHEGIPRGLIRSAEMPGRAKSYKSVLRTELKNLEEAWNTSSKRHMIGPISNTLKGMLQDKQFEDSNKNVQELKSVIKKLIKGNNRAEVVMGFFQAGQLIDKAFP